MTAPWEVHPKSAFDLLLDAVVLIPGLLQRADQIIGLEPTVARRLMAQDLLHNCVNIESHLNQWHAAISRTDPNSSNPATPYWAHPPDSSAVEVQQIPFAETLAFPDGLTAISFIYFWTAQLLFFPCVERLYWTIFEPVVDGPFPQTMPVLPASLQINPLRYSLKEVREVASNICRSLDFALARTVQPDMLAAPLHVVSQFFQHVAGGGNGDVFGDGRLELMWCEAFRVRLAAKGREIQEVVQSKQWRDVTSFQ